MKNEFSPDRFSVTKICEYHEAVPKVNLRSFKESNIDISTNQFECVGKFVARVLEINDAFSDIDYAKIFSLEFSVRLKVDACDYSCSGKRFLLKNNTFKEAIPTDRDFAAYDNLTQKSLEIVQRIHFALYCHSKTDDYILYRGKFGDLMTTVILDLGEEFQARGLTALKDVPYFVHSVNIGKLAFLCLEISHRLKQLKLREPIPYLIDACFIMVSAMIAAMKHMLEEKSIKLQGMSLPFREEDWVQVKDKVRNLYNVLIQHKLCGFGIEFMAMVQHANIINNLKFFSLNVLAKPFEQSYYLLRNGLYRFDELELKAFNTELNEIVHLDSIENKAVPEITLNEKKTKASQYHTEIDDIIQTTACKSSSDQICHPKPDQTSSHTASDQTHITASDQTHITASDQTHITASDQIHVTSSDQTHVMTSDQTQVTTSDQTQVTASDQTQVTASDRTNITASDQTHITASNQIHDQTLVTVSDLIHDSRNDQKQYAVNENTLDTVTDQTNNISHPHARTAVCNQRDDNTSDHETASSTEHFKTRFGSVSSRPERNVTLNLGDKLYGGQLAVVRDSPPSGAPSVLFELDQKEQQPAVLYFNPSDRQQAPFLRPPAPTENSSQRPMTRDELRNKMSDGDYREASLVHLQQDFDVRAMVDAGLYLEEGEDDIIRCYACDLQVLRQEWPTDEDPECVHRQLSPGCHWDQAKWQPESDRTNGAKINNRSSTAPSQEPLSNQFEDQSSSAGAVSNASGHGELNEQREAPLDTAGGCSLDSGKGDSIGDEEGSTSNDNGHRDTGEQRISLDATNPTVPTDSQEDESTHDNDVHTYESLLPDASTDR